MFDLDTNIFRYRADDDKKNTKGFMNKRNILFVVFGIIITAIIIWLTAKFIIKIDFKELGYAMHDGFMHKMGYLWFTLLLLFMVVTIASNSITIIPRVKELNVKIPAWEWVVMSITVSFLKAVTPANLVTDPYTMFWLKTHGCPTSKATSFLFSNTFIWQVALLIIRLPAFIICCTQVNYMIYLPTGGLDAEGISVFVLLTVGFALDVFGVLIMYLLCTSKKFHYWLSTVFNWFKKKLHMKYHTKPEIEEKYKKRAVLKQDFFRYMKDWKGTLIVVFGFVFVELFSYCALGFAFYFVQWHGNDKINFHFGQLFVCANLAITANRLNLIPGSSGGIEWLLQVFVSRLGGWGSDPVSSLKANQKLITTNGIAIWRCFQNYFPAAIDIGGMIGLTTRKIQEVKKNKGFK